MSVDANSVGAAFCLAGAHSYSQVCHLSSVDLHNESTFQLVIRTSRVSVDGFTHRKMQCKQMRKSE